jgi:hypothetical protein
MFVSQLQSKHLLLFRNLNWGPFWKKHRPQQSLTCRGWFILLFAVSFTPLCYLTLSANGDGGTCMWRAVATKSKPNSRPSHPSQHQPFFALHAYWIVNKINLCMCACICVCYSKVFLEAQSLRDIHFLCIKWYLMMLFWCSNVHKIDGGRTCKGWCL